MKIEAKKLLERLSEIKVHFAISGLCFGNKKINEIKVVNEIMQIVKEMEAEEEQKAENMPNYKIDMNLFDEMEIYNNCTVQVLHNTLTDEYSVGWWNNDDLTTK